MTLEAKNSINGKALAWSVGIHVVLLLVFFLISHKVSKSINYNEGGGYEVNLGLPDNEPDAAGIGTARKKKEYKTDVLYEKAASKVKANSYSNHIEKFAGTKDIVPVNSKDSDSKNLSVINNPTPKYTYGGETGETGKSPLASGGTQATGLGDNPSGKGSPNGIPGAPGTEGLPGDGTGGIGHTLKGRKIWPDRFEAEFSEGGKVVIHVAVNRNGSITDKRVVSSPNARLTKIALEKLADTKFSKSDNTEPQQYGDVIFNFKTH